MTTFNTGNPIGSTDSRDRLDNSENADVLENSTTIRYHADRLGTVRKTRYGMQKEHDDQISAHESEHDAQISAHESEFDIKMAGMAFSRVGTFASGYSLTDSRQTLLYATDGHDYGWAGAFPKVVAAGATPATSGGIGAGAWVDRTDVTLRSEIKASSGTSFSIDISVKDAARQAVEGATGGKVTIMYDAQGNPNYMVRIPKFNIQDVDATLGTGVHPAFIINGVEKSEIWIGQHIGSLVNGVLCSLPGKDQSAGFNFDSAVSYCRNKGSGWHTMTTMEWNAVALWCKKNGFIPRGNSNYGRSSDATYETGTRYDGIAPGTASGTARTITGSGPASWRHNNDFAGISDLVGNVWEWAPGFRLVAGELQVIANNDAAMSTIDLTSTSASWKAIDGATGLLVAPGSANTVKIAASGTANYTLVLASGGQLQAMANPGAVPVSAAALITLKLYGAYPVGPDLGGDGFLYNVADERVAVRGGHWGSGALAGLFAVDASNLRLYTSSYIRARPAFSN